MKTLIAWSPVIAVVVFLLGMQYFACLKWILPGLIKQKTVKQNWKIWIPFYGIYEIFRWESE
jgi:hypothetical protein